MKKQFTLFALAFVIICSTKTYAQCDPPTNLASSYSNNVSTFTWDAVPGAIGYRFQFKFQWGSWNSVPVDEMLTTNSYSYTGLFQSAPFEWRVSTDCGSSQSAFSPTQSYATPCPQPSGLTVTSIAGTSATLNWIAAPGYNTTTSDFVVSYRLANTSNAWTSLGHTSGFSKTVTGLLSNTTYEWCVNQSCMYSLSNPVISQFTTLYVPCNIPTNLGVTNISGTQATVSWLAVTGGLTYSIEYKPTTSSTWSVVSSNTTNRILTGLTQSTLYDCRVKANCSGSTSAYITSQFTTYTTTCPSYGTNTSEWIDYFSIGTITRTSGAEIGGYYKSNLSTNLLVGSVNNNVSISAGYKPGIVLGEYYAIYIDFNRNGNFGDAGERVVAPMYISSGSYYGTAFNIPGNVTPGPAKMRVILRRSNTAIVPCATGFSGETEDYDVNLVTALLRGVSNDAVTINDDKVESGITVSPNPSEGLFTITLSKKIQPAFYEVVNMNGSVVQKQTIAGNSLFSIDITKMSKGLYLLRVTDQSGQQQVQKLVKN